MKTFLRLFLPAMAVGVLLAGCSRDEGPAPPGAGQSNLPTENPLAASWFNGGDKIIHTEALGDPGIPLPEGSGIAIAGTGLETQPGTINLNVPGTVKLALLYWSGGDPTEPFDGDNTLTVNGDEIVGELIGGPTPFYSTYQFLAFRADVTDRIATGDNALTVSGMEFDATGQENNGAGLLVVYENGPLAEIQLRDGLDMAFFNFSPPLDATVPQTFTFMPEDVDRSGDLSVFAGSVGTNRPNLIRVTPAVGVQEFDDPLGSLDLPLWDSVVLPVVIPAGVDELTVELISTPTFDPLGASMSWIAGGLSIPVDYEPGLCRVTGGCRDLFDQDGMGWDDYTCGGQAGAPTSAQPQPWGEWTHTQKDGPSGSFTFHAGTASAPENTEIDWIECMDAGWCRQARPAYAKQIDFAGVGVFKNMHPSTPASIADNVEVGKSLHWFEVNIDDLGEPGHSGKVDPPGDQCDPLGHGRNSDTELADCSCPDFYRIRIHAGATDASPVMYEVYGYIDKGNFQIHP